MPSQVQIMEQERRRIADRDNAFMELVNHPSNPLTRDDLAALIRKHPLRYGRYVGFLDKLPRATEQTWAGFIASRNEQTKVTAKDTLGSTEELEAGFKSAEHGSLACPGCGADWGYPHTMDCTVLALRQRGEV